MNRVTVGLTGGIGAGKSTVGRILAELGATVISGDELGREVVESNHEVRLELKRVLGAGIESADGALDRSKIAQLVFDDPRRTEWLTQLTFPHIHAKWRRLRDDSYAGVIVFDAALIFEWKIEREFDVLLVIRATNETILTRSHGRFTPEDLRKRAQRQLPVDAKAATATHVIENDGDLFALKQKVEEFWNQHIAPRSA